MPTIRLATLVKNALVEEKGLTNLVEAINDAIRERRLNGTVDPRTLKKIAENPGAVNYHESLLLKLDAYFSRKGRSIMDLPFFEKDSLMECLWEKRKLCFLLGSQPRGGQRNDLSRWDARSMALLLSEACRSNNHMDYELADVIAKPDLRLTDVAGERWSEILQNDRHSVVSFGSPRASPASELMLASMFGRTAFQRPSVPFDPRLEPPFAYAWLKRAGEVTRSAFALDRDHLRNIDSTAAAQARRRDYLGFYLDGALHEIPTKGNQWIMYGIIAAQRQPGGHVWLVISGISGPATFAAAKLIPHLAAEVPWARAGQAPVLWVPVQARIMVPDKAPHAGDVREVLDQSIMGPLREWPPS